MIAPKHLLHVLWIALSLGGLFYGLGAYEFVPSVWRFVERRHPALDLAGTRSFTVTGIPGDPLNLAFIGSELALRQTMTAGQWHDADPINLRTSVHIVIASAAHRAYLAAPVSNLYVLGRKQDLAFEAAAGADPSKRHHVRFWKMPTPDLLDRTLWIGAATYDSGVGISRTTGQVTHHIAADIDGERNKIVADLRPIAGLQVRWIEHYQSQLEGRNGGGDRYYTDGSLALLEAPSALFIQVPGQTPAPAAIPDSQYSPPHPANRASSDSWH